MTRKYQVFVSSTFTDLNAARREVSLSLLKANCFPAGMELFPTADVEQFEFIKQTISESDYYVIISAGRYGSVHPDTGVSYTEMEYDYAVEIGKPILRLVHRDPLSSLFGRDIENTDEGRAKLLRFREKITNRRLVSFWSEASELGQLVILGLLEAQRRTPKPGWVRGTDAPIAGEMASSNEDFVAAVESAVRAYLGSQQSSTSSPSDGVAAQDNPYVLEAVARLASGIAHAFNALTVSIGSRCDLLLMRHGPDDPSYSDLISIRRDINRAASLVSQLLALARKQALNPEPVNLNSLIDDLFHLLIRLAGEAIHLEKVNDSQAPVVNVDKRNIEQVIMNLVVNARDAIEHLDGRIVVDVSRLEVDANGQYRKRGIPNGVYAQLRVTDNGMGIPSASLSRIFEPMYSTKPPSEGTGLGLSVVAGIVAQSNGYMFVESEVGRGTRFIILLPEQPRELSM